MLLGVAVSSCTPARSYESTADGSTIYLDELSEEERAQARDRIAQALNRGYVVYELRIGDEVEIFFHVDRRPTEAVLIAVDDKLRIEFLGETDTAERWRSDRMVRSRPVDRPVRRPERPLMVRPRSRRRYAGCSPNRRSPSMSPRPTRPSRISSRPSRPLARREASPTRCAGRHDIVPVIGSVPARGRPLNEVQREIDAAYAAKGSASGKPRAAHVAFGTNVVLVRFRRRASQLRPADYGVMAVAQAGGVLPTGSLENIRVFYIGNENVPHVRRVNLKLVLDDLRLEQDMVVPPNSVVYVPPTVLARAGRLMDAVVRDILRYQGFNISGSFLMNNPSGATVITNTTP